MDVFASALGAFLILSVFLFPSYQKHILLEKIQKDIEATAERIADLGDQLSKAELVNERQVEELVELENAGNELAACEEETDMCRAALKETFIVFGVEWKERCDIDIYVKDPDGHMFDYSSHNRDGTDFPNTEAQLSLDMLDGPGLEIWQNPNAAPGLYEMSLSPRDCGGAVDSGADPAVEISTWLLDRSHGKSDLQRTAIPASGGRHKIAVVRVGSDGSTELIEGSR